MQEVVSAVGLVVVCTRAVGTATASAPSRRVRHLRVASLVHPYMKHVCDIGLCVCVCVYVLFISSCVLLSETPSTIWRRVVLNSLT